MMDILSFIDLAIKTENTISGLYEAAAKAAAVSSPELVLQLKTLAHEEIGHANVLRMGRNYAAAMPDLFSRKNIEVGEAQRGFEDSQRDMISVPSGNNLKSLLAFLLDMEKRFERLHLTVSVAIADDSLKSFFITLSKGDHSHIEILNKMLAAL
jgi:rubrerythrin